MPVRREPDPKKYFGTLGRRFALLVNVLISLKYSRVRNTPAYLVKTSVTT